MPAEFRGYDFAEIWLTPSELFQSSRLDSRPLRAYLRRMAAREFPPADATRRVSILRGLLDAPAPPPVAAPA